MALYVIQNFNIVAALALRNLFLAWPIKSPQLYIVLKHPTARAEWNHFKTLRRAPNTYPWDFSDVIKLHVAVQRNQSSSDIRKYWYQKFWYITDIDILVSVLYRHFIGFLLHRFNVNLKRDNYISKIEYLIWQCDTSLHLVTSLLVRNRS